MEYRVTWEIDVEADSPEEAALAAREYQLKPDAQIGVFMCKTGKKKAVKVDLDFPDGE